MEEDGGFEDKETEIVPRLQPTKKRKRGSFPLSSVVKIFVTRSEPNYKMPWQKTSTSNHSGSGFIIDGNKIVTNAHVIANCTSILVRKNGLAKKYLAEILCVAYQCDLALLTVSEPTFWDGVHILPFGEVPHLQESVTCVGYPCGGDNISVTCGVVSRIAVKEYSSHYDLLVIQIDAAINSGNSGGPVINNHNEIIGVAFSRKTTAQNVGYIIPTQLIKRFLEEYSKSGKCIFVDIGIAVAPMENESLRKYHKIGDQTGILVTKINPCSSFFNVVNENDVLLSFDDHIISDDGSIVYRDSDVSGRGVERLPWTYIAEVKFSQDLCKLKVLRNGEILFLESKIENIPKLVPRIHGFDAFPSYYIFSGLVFAPLSLPLIKAYYGSAWSKHCPTPLRYKYYYQLPEKRDQQVVVMQELLASEISVGYRAGIWCTVLVSVNGVEIHNLKHLVSVVEDIVKTGDEFVRFKFGEPDKEIVLEVKKAVAISAIILEKHSIFTDRSKDLVVNTNNST